MVALINIQEHVINKLTKGLSPALTYHNVAHTLDVLRVVTDIAEKENVDDESDLTLLNKRPVS